MTVKKNLLVTGGIKRRGDQQSMDTYVQVFDIRTMRPLSPLSFLPGVAALSFTPKFQSTIVVASPQGQFQMLDAEQFVPSPMEQVHTNAEALCALNVSQSGELMVFADSDGALHLWSDVDPPPAEADPDTGEMVPSSFLCGGSVNMESYPTDVFSLPPPSDITYTELQFAAHKAAPPPLSGAEPVPPPPSLANNALCVDGPLSWVSMPDVDLSYNQYPLLSDWHMNALDHITSTFVPPPPVQPIDKSLIPGLTFPERWLGTAPCPTKGFVRNCAASNRKFTAQRKASEKLSMFRKQQGHGDARRQQQTSTPSGRFFDLFSPVRSFVPMPRMYARAKINMPKYGLAAIDFKEHNQ
jgi:hypothetical protein